MIGVTEPKCRTRCLGSRGAVMLPKVYGRCCGKDLPARVIDSLLGRFTPNDFMRPCAHYHEVGSCIHLMFESEQREGD